MKTTVLITGADGFVGQNLQLHLAERADVAVRRFTRANTLAEHDGRLTGKVCGAIVDAVEKERLLRFFASTLPADRRASIALGDGANDLPMLHAATLGVAYHAKPKVREQVPVAINIGGMDTLLALLP